jgi:putative thioredoxin
MTSAQQSLIRDVNTAEFEQAVIAESRRRPVVVDFWAAWCGPCRQLGPILERAVAAQGGAVLLAKVDVDSNQQLAARFGVQGIPAVKAFRDGKVVSEFTGAQPEPQVRRWLQQLVPSASAGLAEQAAGLAAAGKLAEAERLYREALGKDPADAASLRGLTGLLLARDPQAAQALLAEVPSGAGSYQLARQLLDLIPLFSGAQAAPRGKASAASDLDERWRLAGAAARQGGWEQALDQLLAIVMRDRAYRDDGARKATLALFALLGDAHPAVPPFRKKLANALF